MQTTVTYLCEENGTKNTTLFIKNSAYQDKTEIQNSTPSMAYWGSLVDNAEKTAEIGKNLEVIIGLVKTALETLQKALVEQNSQLPQTNKAHSRAFVLG